MECIQCDNDTKVVDSRPTLFGTTTTIRRRRQCTNCDVRYTTFELCFESDESLLAEIENGREAIKRLTKVTKYLTQGALK